MSGIPKTSLYLISMIYCQAISEHLPQSSLLQVVAFNDSNSMISICTLEIYVTEFFIDEAYNESIFNIAKVDVAYISS